MQMIYETFCVLALDYRLQYSEGSYRHYLEAFGEINPFS